MKLNHFPNKFKSVQIIAESLGGKKNTKGWIALCPAHDDRRPSLALSEGENGKALVKCFAGCSQADVISALRNLGLWGC